jgi:uncharacterized protein
MKRTQEQHCASSGRCGDAVSVASYLRAQSDGVWIQVKLQPRAATSGIVGPHGGELRIRVTAPPVDAAANRALINLLALKLDCSRSQIELVRGHTSRHKVLRIVGVAIDQIHARLQAPTRPMPVHTDAYTAWGEGTG